MIDQRLWRGPDGCLRITFSGLSCPSEHGGSSAAKVAKQGQVFRAYVPESPRLGASVWRCVTEDGAAHENFAGLAAARFFEENVVGCWPDGSLAVRGEPSEVAWATEMLRRERAGLPVFWSEEAREERRAA